MVRAFLALVGGSYLVLALWCSALPHQTARAIGFHLEPGLGESEYLALYGGMQVALAILFLLPLAQPSMLDHSCLACVVVHACLVLFRTIGFARFGNFPVTTYLLASVEWIILIGSAIAWTSLRK